MLSFYHVCRPGQLLTSSSAPRVVLFVPRLLFGSFEVPLRDGEGERQFLAILVEMTGLEVIKQRPDDTCTALRGRSEARVVVELGGAVSGTNDSERIIGVGLGKVPRPGSDEGFTRTVSLGHHVARLRPGDLVTRFALDERDPVLHVPLHRWPVVGGHVLEFGANRSVARVGVPRSYFRRDEGYPAGLGGDEREECFDGIAGVSHIDFENLRRHVIVTDVGDTGVVDQIGQSSVIGPHQVDRRLQGRFLCDVEFDDFDIVERVTRGVLLHLLDCRFSVGARSRRKKNDIVGKLLREELDRFVPDASVGTGDQDDPLIRHCGWRGSEAMDE